MSALGRRIPDTRKLRYVVAVAAAGSFTGATKLLAITQSALTKSVAELEEQLGYPLFERLPRGVRPTPAGEIFLQRAELLLSERGDLMTQMDEIADLQAGKLRVGVAPFAFIAFLDKCIPAFAKVYPRLQVEVRSGTVDEMARALINREIDVCVGASNYLKVWTEFETRSLGALSTFVIGRKGHPAGASPSASELLQYPMILPATGLSTEVNVAGAFRAAGLQPRPPHYVCDYFPVVLELVAKTDAISPVVTLGEPGKRFRNSHQVYEGVIALEAHEIGYSLFGQSLSAPTPAVRVFIDLFESLLSSQGQSIV